MLADVQPDLVLCDVQMPGMDGMEVCERLKAMPEWSDLPVLFVTAEHDTSTKLRGFEVGASDYITKGANEAEVGARVRAHVRISQMQRDLRTSRDAMHEQLQEIRRQTEERERLDEQLHAHQVQLMQNEKMASVGQLAAGVAHEINNPIGFIASNLNSLREYLGGLESVVRSALHLHDSVTNEAPDVQTHAKAFGRVCEEADLDYVLDDLASIVNESIEGTDRVRKIVADLRDFSHVDSPDLMPANVNDLIDKTLSVAANELKVQGGRRSAAWRTAGDPVLRRQAEAGPAQPVRQRRAGDRRARHDHRDDGVRRRLDLGRGQRHRLRHVPGNAGPRLRPVLHHQARRQRDRSRAAPEQQDRRGARRTDVDPQHPRRGNHVPRRTAAGRPAGADTGGDQ